MSTNEYPTIVTTCAGDFSRQIPLGFKTIEEFGEYLDWLSILIFLSGDAPAELKSAIKDIVRNRIRTIMVGGIKPKDSEESE